VLLEVVRRVLGRREVVFDQSIQQAREFRAQIKELQDRQDFLDCDLTKWKEKYYALMAELAIVKSERDMIAIDIKRLQTEVAALRAEVDRRTGGK
jgi:predicted phage-related endonuclease